MKQSVSRYESVAARFAVVLLLAFFCAFSPLQATPSGKPKSEYQEIAKGIELFGDIYRELSANYVEPLDVSALMYAAIDGMVASLDPYTVFLDERQSEQLEEITSGRYTGIGISMARFSGTLYVTSVLEGYPAWKAGLRIGDRIERIDDVPLQGKSLDEIKEMIKGNPGTTLSMKIGREGSLGLGTVRLSREAIRVSTVSYSGIVGNTGYVELDSFSGHSGEDVRQALEKLFRQASEERRSLDGLVLDLRGNPGGVLGPAVEIASLFVDKGSTVVTIRGRTSESEKVYKTERPPLVAELPLVVLIDHESASASEIVAGALQDLDRGVVLGQRSYGKGLVQSVFQLPYDTTLKLTTARYYTPSGRLIQKQHARDGSLVRRVLKEKKERKLAPVPVYYTVGKRKVYGGGGIVPDITVKEEQLSDYQQLLFRQGMVFRFAIRYRATHPVMPGPALNGKALMRDFEKFLREQKFAYTSPSERQFAALLKSTGMESGKAGGTDLLKQEIERQKAAEIEKESQRTARLLEREIVRHYNESLSRQAELGDDPVVRRALALLSDPKAYSRLFRP